MSRSPGSQNKDFAEARAALLGRLRAALLADHPPTSFRSLATAAGVTIPTLRHYFGDREEVLAAVFADCLVGGQAELKIAQTPSGPFRQSIHDLLHHLVGGFRHGRLDRLHSVGLTEGLSHARVAQSYLASILEPTLIAVGERLQAHIARGEMRVTDPRHAALALVSPVLLLFLHQHQLGGASSHPTDIDAFITHHAEAFTTAHQSPPPTRRKHATA